MQQPRHLARNGHKSISLPIGERSILTPVLSEMPSQAQNSVRLLSINEFHHKYGEN